MSPDPRTRREEVMFDMGVRVGIDRARTTLRVRDALRLWWHGKIRW